MELLPHQKRISTNGIQILKEHQLLYLVMPMRTGKTLTSLSTAYAGGYTSILFITLKKAISSIKKDFKNSGLTDKMKLTVINYESVHKIQDNFDLVIIDEAHSLGTFTNQGACKCSKRMLKVKEICKGLPIIFLSAIPTPQSFSQLYHQFYVSDDTPFKYPSTRWDKTGFLKWFSEYGKLEYIEINGFKKKVYSNCNADLFFDKIKHLFLSCTSDDSGLDNNTKFKTLYVPPDIKTIDAVETMHRNFQCEINDYKIIAETPSTYSQKLSQLVNGHIIANNGDTLIFSDFKAQYIKSNRNTYFKGKISVFYKFVADKVLLEKTFNTTNDSVEFNESSDPSLVWIGQYSSSSMGVDLRTADSLIFFGCDYSSLLNIQAKARLLNFARNKESFVYILNTDIKLGAKQLTVEDKILNSIAEKQKFYDYWYKKLN